MSVYAAAGRRMWSPCELSSRYKCETNKQKSWFTWLEATWQDWFNSVLQLNKVVWKLARRVWLHRLNSQAFPGSVRLVSARLCACSTCMLSHYWYVVCRVRKNTLGTAGCSSTAEDNISSSIGCTISTSVHVTRERVWVTCAGFTLAWALGRPHVLLQSKQCALSFALYLKTLNTARALTS